MVCRSKRQWSLVANNSRGLAQSSALVKSLFFPKFCYTSLLHNFSSTQVLLYEIDTFWCLKFCLVMACLFSLILFSIFCCVEVLLHNLFVQIIASNYFTQYFSIQTFASKYVTHYFRCKLLLQILLCKSFVQPFCFRSLFKL